MNDGPNPGAAAPLVERYVTRAELAGIMRVSESTIKRWDREGLPKETWGMKRTIRYRPSECIAWVQERADRRVE